MEKGYLAIILHAHLPFVRHPEHESFLEESWFYEAVTETYIPLVKMLDRLLDDGVDFKLTVSLSPTLLIMLRDGLLGYRYLRHLEKLIELSAREIERTKDDAAFNRLAHMYHNIFKEARHIYVDRYKRDLTAAFKKFNESGKVEVITCCATHGYLPLMDLYKPAVRMQVKVAVETYKKIFGSAPKGVWLPECGYSPDHDGILKEFGIKYFIVESHGILFATPRPRFGVYTPYMCKSGVAVYARDMESSKAVWSALDGYPGDFNYREFYRDIGYDLDYEYVRPYLNGDGTRINTGIKYYRITGRGDYKEPYVSHIAQEKAAGHAGNFMFNREKQIEYLYDKLGRRPIIVSPYDAELFGHWWFEGIDWLNFLMRKISYDQNVFKLTTPGEYLKIYPKYQVLQPSLSSWGWKGYNEVWLEGSNDWIYRHLHKITEHMIELANLYPNAEGDLKLALNQLARELLLAQSSDWAFMMKTNIFTQYAIQREKDHIVEFLKIYDMVKNNDIDAEWLRKRFDHYNAFPDIDYAGYKSS